MSFGRLLGHQYTIFDGLAGMQVEDIYQDRRGLLWVATADGGVSRFDGAHFYSFGLADGLPSLTVMTIAEDQDGRLIFGTLGGGLAAYDGRGFQVYTTEHGLPSNDIVSLQPRADGSMRVRSVSSYTLKPTACPTMPSNSLACACMGCNALRKENEKSYKIVLIRKKSYIARKSY